MNQLTVSLWGDEAFASILAQKSLTDIVTIVARDTSPPLHYILLHFWMQLFGTSEIAIRTLPMLLYVLLAFVVHKFAEEVYNVKASYWAFFLALFNPFLFVYAFEARMYMLLALLSTMSMWFYATKRWRWYIFTTAAALYTHHFSIFIILVQVIHYIWENRFWERWTEPLHEIQQQTKSPFVLSIIAIIILYAPWLPALYGQTTMVAGDFWLPKPSFYDLRVLFEHFLAGLPELIITTPLLLASLVLLYLRGFDKKKDIIFYLWLLLPAVLTFLMSQVSRPLFFDRYLIISAAAIPILIASQKTSKLPAKNIATALLIFVAAGLIFINFETFQNPVKQPFRDVANFVYENYGKDKKIINYYTDALHYFELKHYGVNVKVYSPSGPLPFWVGTALIDPNDILNRLPEDKSILVMAGGDVNRVSLPGYFEIRRERFRNLNLIWYMKE